MDEIGWFFKQTEISNGIWCVEGKDAWGRAVSSQGSDLEGLLKEVIEMAQKLNESLPGVSEAR